MAIEKDNQHTAIRPADKDHNEMFIGWTKAPAVDRRFLLGALPLSLLTAGGLSYQIASELNDPDAGSWLTGKLHQVTGLYSTYPYPHMRVIDETVPGGVRTILVVTQGKCTSDLQKNPSDARPITATGYLIERKNRQMLEISPLRNDWLSEQSALPVETMDKLTEVVERKITKAEFSGVIMDSKCFFGVMRPSRGMTHKACASLCIRGGIPPSFWVRDNKGNEQVMLMTTREGKPMPLDILPLIAEPVRVNGHVVQVGDILHFRADADDYRLV